MVRGTSFGAVVGVWTKSEFGNGCYTFGLGFAKDLLGPIWSLQTLAYMGIEKEEGREVAAERPNQKREAAAREQKRNQGFEVLFSISF